MKMTEDKLSAEEMLKERFKFARDFPEMDSVVSLGDVNIIIKRAKEEERGKTVKRILKINEKETWGMSFETVEKIKKEFEL